LSDIRVTYSGLIAFAVNLVGIITGMLFVIIVTRRLSPEEFGLWTLIGSMVYYVFIIEPVISYWNTRQIARGEQVGKTALAAGSLFSIGGFTIYSVMAIIVSSTLGASFHVLMLASALIPLNMLNSILGSIFLGYKPQVVSYGIITFESSKFPLGLIFVYFAQLGIVGALLATIGAMSFRTILLLILARKMIIGTIKLQVIKFWLRMSWLVAYQQFNGIIFRLDVMLISFVTLSFTGLALWGAAQTIGYLVIHSGQISQALYPKLLAKGKKEFAIENLKRTMFFAIPLLAASIVFAKPGLTILNPLYAEAVYPVYFIAFGVFVNTLRAVFFKILSGFETVDETKDTSFRKYIKSKLFLLPTLDYIYTVTYIALLAFFLFFIKTPDMSDVFIVTVWSFIMFAVSVPLTTYTIILAKKQHQVTLPFKAITKYSLVATFTGIIIFFLSQITLTYPESIFEFLPEIIPLALLAGGIYFGLTYLIDDSTRKLYKSILKELKRI